MTRLPMIELHCRKCRKPLLGENNSLVFFCLDCALALNLENDASSWHEVRSCRAALEEAGEKFYLAFWQFEGEFQGSKIPDRRLYFVPATVIRNTNYFGDLGLYYTRRQPPTPPAPLEKIRVFPADRSLATAQRFAALYFMKQFESAGQTDLPKLEFFTAEILLVPFFSRDKGVYDGLLGWRYPAGILL